MLTQIQHQIDHFIFSKIGILELFWLASSVFFFVCGRSLIEWFRAKGGSLSPGGFAIIGSALVSLVGGFLFLVSVALWMRHGRTLHAADLPLLIFPSWIVLYAVLGHFVGNSRFVRGGPSFQGNLLVQIFLAMAFMLALYSCRELGTYQMGWVLSATQSHALFSSWLVVACEVLVIVGAGKAVQLTDGIEGLVAGICLQVTLVFSWLWLSGPGFPNNSMESTTFLICFCLGGSCLAFLTIGHCLPRILGGPGSLGLGAALAVGTMVTRTVWLVPFVGFVFCAELISAIIEMAHFRYTKNVGEGDLLLHRFALHRHLGFAGWSERRVANTFWVVNFCTTLIGVALWKQGLLPRFP